MFDSSIRVAILSTSGHEPFPELGIAPVILSQFVDFEQFISEEADLYIIAIWNIDPNSMERFQKVAVLAAKPVLINAVDLPGRIENKNWFRYNGWPGFGSQPVLEIGSVGRDIPEVVLQFTMAAGLTCLPVPDQIGLIRPRILAMIVNEAFHAFGEGLSSRDEIDTAMKLGTGYPFGPFEWGERIGFHRILVLLENMAATEPKYQPAPALQKTVRESGIKFL